MASRPSKRVKLDSGENASLQTTRNDAGTPDASSIRSKRAAFLNSISRSISPPGISRSGTTTPQAQDHGKQRDRGKQAVAQPVSPLPCTVSSIASKSPSRVQCIPSPFKLTTIRDLPATENTDAVSLHDILGNPLIKEAWIFNYCFDVDWLMTHFDVDVRSQVSVKVVHGSWKSEDVNKLGIDDACRRWPNVESVAAYLPDQFGTHHSKMFILFTHDDQAQVVIHTANMLQKDWTNMTQAVWQSPMLPKLPENPSNTVGKIGSGSRFRHDLMTYLTAYGSKTRSLRNQLSNFDFARVRGALIASVPSHVKNFSTTKNTKTLLDQTLWGYPSLFRALKTIQPREQSHSVNNKKAKDALIPHVVCQISSIATLPNAWLSQFLPVLCNEPLSAQLWQHLSIIYPTPGNVAASLDGYVSGGSIHTKAQSPAHLKQITTLRKSLCQWTRGTQAGSHAGRDTAAPHIKTYVRFATKPTAKNPQPDVEWALLTSANLSTQAWGTIREKKDKEKEVVVQSFEIGVLVWPELFAEDFDAPEQEDEVDGAPRRKNLSFRMVPVFDKDMPSPDGGSSQESTTTGLEQVSNTLVGLRLPYDLPVTPYNDADLPWSPQGSYDMPDRHGRRWPRDFF